MSNDQKRPDGGQNQQQRVDALEQAIADQKAQFDAAMLEQRQTIDALRSLLTERREAAITPAAPTPVPNRYLEIERKTQEQEKKRLEDMAATKRAVEAGEYKFRVCIFSPSEEGVQSQLSRIKGEGVNAPWESKIKPLHPWMTVGVDAPDARLARMLAKEKYNEAKGINLLDRCEHTIYRIDEYGNPIGDEADLAAFSKQVQRAFA